MIRKNIYTWHRRLSLIIALPVALWAISGLMHPFMTTIKPAISRNTLIPPVLDSNIRHSTSLKQALERNHLKQFHDFRLVSIAGNWFYQVQLAANDTSIYLSTANGQLLQNGDALYARHLAIQFLIGEPDDTSGKTSTHNTKAVIKDDKEPLHDCCVSATRFVMSDKSGADISSVGLVRTFDEEYRSVNRLVPVYKVSFNREDGIVLYVETSSDRLAYAVDKRRAVFDKLFAWFHNWSWLQGIGIARYILMILLLSIAIITTITGIYIFLITKTKKAHGNSYLKKRKNHRAIALMASVFTLMFTFSGAFHAWKKTEADTRDSFYTKQQIPSALATLDIDSLLKQFSTPLINIQAIQMEDRLYWQVFMANKDIPGDHIIYINARDNKILAEGENKYAIYLAGLFSNHSSEMIPTASPINRFEGEYGFINKRLPVWKIGYALNNNERYYVETSSGRLSVRVDDNDLAEGYSFALLHKHHYMDWGGKIVRDASTVIAALLVLLAVLTGIILWLKKNRNKTTGVKANSRTKT